MSELTKFKLRLHELCDENGIPEKGKGRERVFAERLAADAKFKVSMTAVHKWLTGSGFPKMEFVIKIATWGKVHVEWLLSGRGDKYIPSEAPLDERIAFVIKKMEESPDHVVDQIKRVVEAVTAEHLPLPAPYPGDRRLQIGTHRKGDTLKMAAVPPSPPPDGKRKKKSRPPSP